MSSLLSQELIENIERLVGPAGLVRDPELMQGYLTDWRNAYQGLAALVVRPGSTEEVAAVVRLCHDAGVALVPQGATPGCAADRFRTLPVDRWCCP